MDARSVMVYGNATLLRSLDDLSDDEWAAPGACGVWSVKDILAHLASYELVLAEALESLHGSSATPTLDAFATAGPAFNDDEVHKRSDVAAAEVMHEYTEAHERTMAAIQRTPVELRRQRGALSWYGDDYDVEDFLVYVCYGHKREHAAQVAAQRDRLRREDRPGRR